MQIIWELDKRASIKYKDPKVQIIDDNMRVHMAHIDIHYGFSVNGVAAIHTEILKDTELNHFYKIYPEKFNNKTNGITFRRWLLSCNRELAACITDTIGTGYKKDAAELEKLMEHLDDEALLTAIKAIKRTKKEELVAYLKKFNPFGPGNQNPVFCTRNVFDFGTSKLVGKNLEHIKLELEDNSTSRVINAIAFNMAPYFEHIHAHKPIDICYTIEQTKHSGNLDSVQLMIRDIRPSE